MKLLQINSVSYGSTANVMFSISDILNSNNNDSCLCGTGFTWYKPNRPDHFLIGNVITKFFHKIMSSLFGNDGSYSLLATLSLKRKIKKYKPDLIHFHNIHGWFLNYRSLFNFISKTKIPVIWTLHDCWAFTGHCFHFMYENCTKWIDGCSGCVKYHSYPFSLFDNSSKMWKKKNAIFNKITNLTIVTPSKWLSDAVKVSFLKNHKIVTINNGIDLNIFRPIKGNFRQMHSIDDNDFVVLGVSYSWNDKKGLDVFLMLSSRLPNNYHIVLVGTNKHIDERLPKNIISVHKTNSNEELAEIYSSSNVFVNPTREDNYPTVNMEAIACGAPVITFKTGGSPEMVEDNCGTVIECDDINSLEQEVRRVCETNRLSKSDCLNKAKDFDRNKVYIEYLALYKQILNR